MLSLKVFGQRDVDVKAARRRFEGIAKRITERFDDLPRISNKIITKDAYDELRKHPDIVAKFPPDVKRALTSYDSINVFNVVRTMGALDVPDELIMAYMISEKHLEEIMPAVGGSIVPVEQVEEVFVSGEPLCSHNVAVEIQQIQRQIAQLRQKLDDKLLQLDLDQQAAFSIIETNLKKEVSDIGEAMRAWPLLINSFSYTRDFSLSMRSNPAEKGVAAVITRLGNAIYQTMLSRNLITVDALYKTLPLGDLDLNIPVDIELLADITRNSIDPLVVFGSNATTFHALVGRRWLLLNSTAEELRRESQIVDDALNALYADINRLTQNQKLNSLFKDTFPPDFIFHLIKGYTNSREIEDLKANLFSVILSYFELSQNVVTAVQKVKVWWTTRLADIFDKNTRDGILEQIENVNRYIAAYNELASTFNVAETYKLFFTPKYSFLLNVVELFVRLRKLSPVSLMKFNQQDIVAPHQLNLSLSNTQDFDFAQEVIFRERLRDMIDTIIDEIQSVSDNVLRRIYTDVRSCLTFLSHFSKRVQPLLISQGLIDIRVIASNDAILSSFVGSEGIPKYAFFALSNFWSVSNVSIIDAIKNYYAHVHLYRLLKRTRTVSNLDPANRFASFLNDLQTRFDSDEQFDLSNIFETAATAIFSDWNGFEFENAVAAIDSRLPLTILDVAPLDPLLISNRPSFASSVMSNTIGGVVEKDPTVGTPTVPSYQNSTPENLKQATVDVFRTLDTILGGTVSGGGDVVLLDTFLYKIDGRTSLSFYLAALWIFTKITRKDARYANWSSLDMWMYIIDHIDNHKDTTGLLGFQWNDYSAIDTSTSSDVVSIGEFDISTFFNNFTPQYVIDVDTTNEQSLETIIVGKHQYYANFKLGVWKSLPYHLKELIYSWLTPSQYQRHCAVHNANNPYVWIDFKRTLFLLSDEGIAATLYTGFISGTLNPTEVFTSNTYSIFAGLAQNRISFAEAIFKDTTWERLPFYSIGSDSWPAADITVDTFGGNQREYNEFLLIYRQHTAQQYITAFHLTKNSAFPVGLFYKSKAHAQTILDRQALTLIDKNSVITPSILHDIFDSVYRQGVDAISEPLRAVIDNPETTFSQLELFLYVISTTGGKSSSPVIASTITPTSDVTAWDVRAALMFQQLKKSDQASTSSGTSSGQSAIRRFARQVSNALFNASPDVKTTFLNAINAFNNYVMNALTPEEELIYDDEVSYENARIAIDAVFDIFYEIGTSSIVSITDHSTTRSIFQAPFDVLSNTILYNGADVSDDFAIEQIAFFKKLILHLDVNELQEYEQTLQGSSSAYKNWFTKDILSRAFKRESWKERAISFFQNVIVATTYTIQKSLEVKRNMRALFVDLSNNYFSTGMILRGVRNAKNHDLFFIYSVLGGSVARVDVETPEFNLASLIVIALNNSGLLTTNITSITSYRSAAMPPPLFAISYILRTFSGFGGIATHTGLQRFSIKQIRSNAFVEQVYVQVITELNALNELIDLTFDRFVMVLVNVNSMLNKLARYHPMQVVWCMVLEQLARKLETQSTSDIIQNEWFDYIRSIPSVQKDTIITSQLGSLCLKWIVNNIFDEFKHVLDNQISEEDKYNHYTIFTANNLLLTDHGIHRELTLAIANEK